MNKVRVVSPIVIAIYLLNTFVLRPLDWGYGIWDAIKYELLPFEMLGNFEFERWWFSSLLTVVANIGFVLLLILTAIGKSAESTPPSGYSFGTVNSSPPPPPPPNL